MTVSGLTSSSMSTLLSSLSTSSSSSSSSSGYGLYSINLSDYALIKSGTYGKLMKAYVAKISGSSTSSSSSTSSTSSSSSTSTSTSSDSTKTLSNIESDAESLADTAKELYTRSGNKVFAKDASGEYDVNTIYDAVSSFVDDYNSLLDSASSSSVSNISSALSGMTSLTSTNSSLLENVGITVGDDGKLSIDEDTFKASSMDDVKNLFYGTSSYGYGVAVKASMINSYASIEASKSNLYTSTGSYTSTYSSGDLLSAFA
ncbi:MAG: flagellar filament capping protein FliD [Clostridiales bacterium]|nr:flagellar filament capping protein FliD [Clostridiales bacterium]